MTQSSTWKMVGREPRRIVPPRCVFEISGMKMTAGLAASASNSVEVASLMPSTFRQNSIVATCNPRQIPRYGTLFSRAYCAARIFPSIPRSPKPPVRQCTSAHVSMRKSTLKLFARHPALFATLSPYISKAWPYTLS